MTDLDLQVQRLNRKRKIYSFIVLGPLVAALLISSVYTFAPFVTGENPGQAAAPQATEDPRPALEARLKTDPKDLAALVALGNAHYDVQDYPKAEAAYKRALAISPINANVEVDNGTAILYQNRPLEAIAAYKKALSHSPDHVNGHVNLGVAYHTLGQEDKAAKEWHKALALTADPSLAAHIKDLLARLAPEK